MEILKAYATKNDCYKKAQKMSPKGIVVHSTGANNPNLKRYVDLPDVVGVNPYGNHWNVAKPEGRSVCVHAFIGYDKQKQVQVVEILPLNFCCWGVGSGKLGSYNYDPAYIQFEICEDDLTNKTYYTDAFKKAAEYCAHLCKTYNLSVDSIVSHREAYLKGYGSNHSDPEHWMQKHGDSMQAFRKRVKELLEKAPLETKKESSAQVPKICKGDLVSLTSNAVYYNGKSIPSWVKQLKWYVMADPVKDRAVIDKSENGKYAICSPVSTKYLTVVNAVSKTPSSKKLPYLVKVQVDPLPIYKGPGKTYVSSSKITGKGTYTIVEENGTWGKLKSGAGWIELDKVKKL